MKRIRYCLLEKTIPFKTLYYYHCNILDTRGNTTIVVNQIVTFKGVAACVCIPMTVQHNAPEDAMNWNPLLGKELPPTGVHKVVLQGAEEKT